MNLYHHLIKSISCLLLGLMVISCNTRQKQKIGEDIRTLSTTDTFSVQRQTFNNLSAAFRSLDTIAIAKYWQMVLNEKEKMLQFLFSLKGNRAPSGWYWIHTKSGKSQVREYNTPDLEHSALFYICAIHYKDLNFARSRFIYDNKLLKITEDRVEHEDLATDSVEIKDVWSQVQDWNSTGRNGRPFLNSNYYWVGEKGGKIDKLNIYFSIWRTRG